jgi:hypothetical protein
MISPTVIVYAPGAAADDVIVLPGGSLWFVNHGGLDSPPLAQTVKLVGSLFDDSVLRR